MTDIAVKLPANFRYLNQFAPSKWAADPSLLLCGETCAAMAAEFAYPGKYVPEQLIEELCVRFTGQPDTKANPWGTTKGELEDWFRSAYIGFIDMGAMVDEFNKGNEAPLHNEIMAQNEQGVPQIIAVADESFLIEFGTGKNLHSWVNKNDPNHKVYGHVIFRVGYGDGYGLYMEPAAPAFAHPVKIGWNDVKAAGIVTCLAIMPNGVSTPPAGFSYTSAKWPTPPKPAPDLVKLASNLDSMSGTLAQMQTFLNNFSAELKAAQGDL